MAHRLHSNFRYKAPGKRQHQAIRLEHLVTGKPANRYRPVRLTTLQARDCWRRRPWRPWRNSQRPRGGKLDMGSSVYRHWSRTLEVWCRYCHEKELW